MNRLAPVPASLITSSKEPCMSKRMLLVLTAVFALFAALPLAAATRFDTNSDGRADLTWLNTSTDKAYTYQMNGTTISYEGASGGVPNHTTIIPTTADFNGDGRTDAVQFDNATLSGRVLGFSSISMMSGGGPPWSTSESAWKIIGSGDFNGDGRADILFKHQVSGLTYIFFFGTNSGVESQGPWKYFTDPNWQFIGIGDFDGDLKADVLWHNTATGQNYIFFMNGTSASSEGFTKTTPDLAWVPQGIGDLDGDGKADIVFRNTSTGQNYIFLMNGLTVAGEGTLNFIPDQNWSIATVADYDNDTRADIFFRNFSTGENYFFMMAPGGLTVDLAKSGPVKTVLPVWVLATGK
jgi:hypothetical protein